MPRKSLRRAIIYWIVGTAAAIILLALYASISTTILEVMAARIRSDAAAVTTAAQFEQAVSAWMRDELLWRETHDEAVRARIGQNRQNADRLSLQLAAIFNASGDASIMHEVTAAHDVFRASVVEAGGSREINAMTHSERLLTAVQRLMAHAEAKMDATKAQSVSFSRSVDMVCALVLVIGPLLVAFSAWGLWTRIIRSVLGLARAADSFGVGDMTARATIFAEDEMGEVCRTFNIMAEEIAARERERLDFMAAVAHDLRNPLTAIIGTTDLLRKESKLTPTRRDTWTARILAQSRRIEAMTFNLTNAVQIMTGRLVLQLAPLDLARLLRTVAEEQIGAAREERRIIVDASEPCPVMGDGAQLERVFSNLLSNALKYSDERSEVSITLTLRDGNAVVAVADRGIGIPLEELRHIFKPFRRVSGVADTARGTGLGLFSAMRIVEEHGGKLEIRSALKVGTTVEVLLPLAKDFTDDPPPSQPKNEIT